MAAWRTWRVAAEHALYGPNGFYRRPEGPSGHFRTSVAASPLFARALLRLAALVDTTLGEPAIVDLVDVGAGRGELLGTLMALAPEEAPRLAPRLRLVAVERAVRPSSLPRAVGWHQDLDDLPPVSGLLVGNEWLDNVPVDLVEQTADGPRLVLVDARGTERLGPPPQPADEAWLRRWWPLQAPGDRAEVGRPRDETWALAVRRVSRGLAVAIDYGIDAQARRELAPSGATLAGYRQGRRVPPVPDGSCDLTAHVALDACAAAGELAGATGTQLLRQREALRALGVAVGARPPRELASTDPPAYLTALAQAGEATELTAVGGLGDFGWLVQAVGIEVPAPLRPAGEADRVRGVGNRTQP